MAEDVYYAVGEDARRQQRLHNVGDSDAVKQRHNERIAVYQRRNRSAGLFNIVPFAGDYNGVHRSEIAHVVGDHSGTHCEVSEKRRFNAHSAAAYRFQIFPARNKIYIVVLSGERPADQAADSAYSEYSYFHRVSPQSFLLTFCPAIINHEAGDNKKTPAAERPSE